MPMPVPEERVYYHELRECGNVLLCWMPRGELERLVGEGKIEASVLADHPGGVDVEVTPADFSYYRERYRIDVGIAPEDLLLAFEAVMKSSEVDVTGEIRGAVVEDLAKRSASGDPVAWDERKPIALDQARVVLEENPAVQMRVDERLRAIGERAGAAPPDTRFERDLSNPKLALGHALKQIRQSEGEPAAAVFARLQRRSGGER